MAAVSIYRAVVLKLGVWFQQVDTLPDTDNSHLKMDGWKMNFLLGRPIFRGKLLVLGRVSCDFFLSIPEDPGNVASDLPQTADLEHQNIHKVMKCW